MDPMDPMNPGNSWSPEGRLGMQARGAAGFPTSGVMGTATPPMPDTPEPEPTIVRRQVTGAEVLRTLAGGALSPSAILQKLDLPGTSRNIATFTEWLRTWSEAYGYIEPVQYKLTQKGADYLRDHPEPQ